MKELKTARVLSYQRTQLSEDVKDCENDLEDNYVDLLLLGTSRVGFENLVHNEVCLGKDIIYHCLYDFIGDAGKCDILFSSVF